MTDTKHMQPENNEVNNLYWHTQYRAAIRKNKIDQNEYRDQIRKLQLEVAALKAALAAPQPSPDQQLCRFYDVTTFPDLVEAQSRHIEKLQAKLPISTEDLAVKKVREG